MTEELTSLPTGQSIDAISTIYIREYEQMQKVSDIYRFFFISARSCCSATAQTVP